MKLLKTKCKIRCETGGCRNFADYVLYMDRCGVHTSVYLCGQCLSQLKELLSDGCTDEQTASDVLLRGGAVQMIIRPPVRKKKAAGLLAKKNRPKSVWRPKRPHARRRRRK